MDQFEILGNFSAVFFGAMVATICLRVWIKTNSSIAIAGRTLMHEAEDSITFLFEEDVLLDATPRGRTLMEQRDSHRSDWENFLTLLSARFPHLRSQCGDLAIAGKKKIAPQDGQPGWIEAEFWNGLARLTLVQDEDHPDKTIDPLTAAAMEHELETLRGIGEDSPQLIWKHDAEGVLVWANRAYFELSEAIFPVGPDDIRPWPPKPVFVSMVTPAGPATAIDMHRIEIDGLDKPIWYEVTAVRRGTDTIYFAVDATAAVFAQEAQKTFVQTLTKTFAQLSVGLAIFDADRRLVLFNPAMKDLTGLPIDFLIGRPALFSFLDRLRDQNMIPEPKNYANWRDQMVALESAAAEGSYHETWLIPNGQTFRVTGKPHPNGAIAFLMEDISDEVSLTRKYRAQIDTGAAVIDNLKAAVCVFSSSGALIMANRAYRHLWGTDPDGSLSNHDFTDELSSWETASAPSPVWMKLSKTMKGAGGDKSWQGSVWLDNHIELTCQYAPLPDGNHQIVFLSTEQANDTSEQFMPLEFRVS